MGKNTVILERRFVPAGTMIVKEGEEAYGAYLIQSGSVSVFTKQDDKSIELARLSVGEIFGEMALISEERRSANVSALEDCNLILITRQTFEEKLNQSDKTIKAVVSMLVQRLVTGNTVVTNKKSGLKNLIDSAWAIYNNCHLELDEKESARLEKNVKSKLEQFIESVKAFEKSKTSATIVKSKK